MNHSVEDFLARFRIPVIAAPMTGVSGLALASAVSASGIGASFPVHNAASAAELDRWLGELCQNAGLILPNLVVHRTNTRLAGDLAVITSHRVPAVITSVGSPAHVVGPLHDAGIMVLADVASLRHAEHAIATGVDGLVLLTAGAGGQTGWANPFAFIRAVRRIWDGPLVLAGGITDGAAIAGALVAGCDLVYIGTPFIATMESAAHPSYKRAVVSASMDDIELTSDLTGLPTSMIRAGTTNSETHRATAGFDAPMQAQMFSAGHGVSGVHSIVAAAELVDRIDREFATARTGLS
ncbi:NAD(P)H-dependent flavin oxidoreductase [Nocardia terpenica]|uniref:Nitronate monooxygenase n=1 Tax=Nocardia terpenica TaxID=455432 RepID=A0A6G9YUZ5_9NOCA|nr:nitronate monooxygenase [Nocardia terpenica]QIS16947.1 nitronate monooxygenase [Nocardia terpenica]